MNRMRKSAGPGLSRPELRKSTAYAGWGGARRIPSDGVERARKIVTRFVIFRFVVVLWMNPLVRKSLTTAGVLRVADEAQEESVPDEPL